MLKGTQCERVEGERQVEVGPYSARERLVAVGRSMTRASSAGRGVGVPVPGGQDGADVRGLPPAERCCSLQRSDQGVELGQLGPQPNVPGPGSTGVERLRGRPKRAEVLLQLAPGPDRADLQARRALP